ncbi:Tetratricopeptide TPR-1 [Heracleum sosnowskyi]|uniref:Tetratricopeptide TPR-1 n=1 Tax=Heracleum sosnowskyi TaxID=360622 RepID=A0AAD8IEL4_9APIA|nr:Tetratricopeptide TPR-1 [Heracleum sosnowskyi]
MAEIKLVMDGLNGDRYSNGLAGHYVPHKDIFTETSPRSPLSGAHSPDSDSIGLISNGVVKNSIEQLYNNVCDIQSSEQSPTQYSMLSYGHESRIDSELRYLAGEEFEQVEKTKEIVFMNNEPVRTTVPVEKENRQSNEKVGTCRKVPSPTNAKSSHIPSGKPKTLSSRRKPLHDGPPPIKKNLKTNGSPLGVVKQVNNSKVSSEEAYLGPYLLKKTRDLVSLGKISEKVLALALRAKQAFETCADEKPNLEFVMCLHVVAALYCSMGKYNEAIPLLEHSVEIPRMDEGENHALAKFSGCMQLGDTYAMLGQVEKAIVWYTAGLEIQKRVLGDDDPRFGETCRYVSEAHVQILQFDEAEKLCQRALDIYKDKGSVASLEQAANRRLMGLISEAKGDYETALEQYVLASMYMAENGQEADVASINRNIGDALLNLARYDDAIFAYQKALTMFKPTKGENHPTVASIFVRLANLYNKIGKCSESKSYCKNALRIYMNPVPNSSLEEIFSGLIEVSAIYESLNDLDQSLSLLQKASKLYDGNASHQSTLAVIEAQMGALNYMKENHSGSYKCLKNAIAKFRSVGEKKSALFATTLNQMGLVCLHLDALHEAANMFEEARGILEAEYGPHHPDTLGVYRNLAGTYDAMGRRSDAIVILELLVAIKEEKLGIATSDVEDETITATREEKLGIASSDMEEEKMMLSELLKEGGMVRNRKLRSLDTLLDTNSTIAPEE